MTRRWFTLSTLEQATRDAPRCHLPFRGYGQELQQLSSIEEAKAGSQTRRFLASKEDFFTGFTEGRCQGVMAASFRITGQVPVPGTGRVLYRFEQS